MGTEQQAEASSGALLGVLQQSLAGFTSPHFQATRLGWEGLIVMEGGANATAFSPHDQRPPIQPWRPIAWLRAIGWPFVSDLSRAAAVSSG